MRTIKLLSIASLAALAIACSKEKDTAIEDPNSSATSFSQLNISKSFNWSSSVKGNITITLDAPQSLYTEGQTIEIVDGEGNTLQASVVSSGQASFNISVPAAYDDLYAYYPNTQDKVKINLNKRSTTLSIEAIDFSSGLDNNFFQTTKAGRKSTATGGTELIIDGGFENSSLPLDNNSITQTRSFGAWYKYNNASTITSVNGTKVFTSNVSGNTAAVLQSLGIAGDHMYNFSYNYSGEAGFYILFFDQNKNYIGHSRVNVSNNGTATSTFLASNQVHFVQFYGFAGINDWLDNASLTQVVEADTDGDGVIDRKDFYPNDPNKTYATMFPTVGRQIMAFEDLWPHKGDYDFNDFVLSNHIEFGYDKDHNLVDATVRVQINAIGASISHGVGLHLLDENNNPFNNNIISGITMINGNTVTQLDANVKNGVVVMNNVFKSLKTYYSNTGKGPSGEPEEFIFNIQFASGIGSINITPDFYIFRTEERGREIHLSGFSGTEAANTALYNTGDDVNGTYKSANGLPWAIEVIYPLSLYYKHPLEKIDVLAAYPRLSTWATSNGLTEKNWMLYPVSGLVYEK